MKKDVFVWGGAICIMLLLCYFYYTNNPSGSNITIKCSFHSLTGYFCTGCGGQRAFHHLLHGEFLEAFRYNILIILLPFFIYLLYITIRVYFFKENKYLNSFLFSKQLGVLILVVSVLYTILRNIPYEPFVYLAPPK